jgi:hypothetical protein
MADPQTNLRVKISADLADIKSALVSLRGDLDKTKQHAHQTFEGNITGHFLGQLHELRAQLGNMVGAFVGLEGLRLGIEGLFGALDRSAKISETAKSIGITTEALSKLQFAAKHVEIDPEQLNKGLERFSKNAVKNEKEIKALGVATRDAQGNFRQLDAVFLDLADVFEKLPAGQERTSLAMQLFGKTGADLIPLFAEGRAKLEEYGITAEKTGNVITEKAAAAAHQFKENLDNLKATLTGVANETVKNLLPGMLAYSAAAEKSAIGQNNAAESGKVLAGAFKYVAAAAIIVKNVVEGVVTVIAFYIDVVSSFAKAIVTDIGGAIGAVAKTVGAFATGGALSGMIAFTKATTELGSNLKSQLTGVPDAIRSKVSALTTGLSEAATDIKNVGAMFDDAAASAEKNTGETNKTGTASAAAAAEVAKLLKTIHDFQNGEGKGGKKSKVIDGIVKDAEVAVADIKSKLKDLDELFADHKVKIAEYFAQKQALELAGIDAQLAQATADAKAAKSSDAQSAALTKIVELQHQRAEIGPRIAREQAKAELGLADALQVVRDRIEEINGHTAAATRAKLDKEFRELLARLKAEGRDAEAAVVAGFIDASVVKAQVKDFETQASKILGDLRAAETSFGAQAAGGLMGGAEAEQRANAERTLALTKLRDLRGAVEEYYAKTKDPTVLAFLQQLTGDIGGVQSAQQELMRKGKDVAVSALSTFFSDLATGAKSAKQAVQDFVKSFVTGIAQIISQKLAMLAVDRLIQAFGGGASVGVHHTGGIAGAAGTSRNVNPMLFGMAPRYHSGGIAGLNPGEVPAILQAGEEVLPTSDPRHRRNGGLKAGGGDNNVVVNIHNNSGAQVETQERSDGGTRFLEVIIGAAKSAVAQDIGSNGMIGKTIANRYGLAPVGVSRG